MGIKAKIIEIRGHCPVYELEDEMIIKGPEIDLEKSDSVCVHALPSLLHYNIALGKKVNPKELGLSKEDNEEAYLQCPDPGEPYTDGGTVIFEVVPIEE